MLLKEIALVLGLDDSIVPNIKVKELRYDSRQVQPEDLFIAVSGTKVDGHDYLSDAAAKGAAALLVERQDVPLPPGIPVLYCNNSRLALAQLSAFYYGYPDRGMRVVGVTGTNGKTTTTKLIKWLWEQNGAKIGLVGTINNQIGGEILHSSHTTPGPLELGELLKEMHDANCHGVVMEVSSHALLQDRVTGCHFDYAIFTNLTQDHLDYHHSFEAYLECKLRLFKLLGSGPDKKAIVNIDDPYAGHFIKASQAPVITYGINNEADLRAVNLLSEVGGTGFELLYQGRSYHVHTPLSGRFNVYNSLAALSFAVAEGIDLAAAISYLAQAPQVAGRFEKVAAGQNFTVIVDYAHTPDGLENLLTTAKDISRSRLICVFGCGGDRDKTKRPLMGAIAGRYCDFSVITSDNPRTEEPNSIISQIEAGLKDVSNAYCILPDRREAIDAALTMAGENDVVVIAGKGHEDYQLVGGKVLSFDDRLVAREILERLLTDRGK